MIERFEVGKSYRWIGGSERPVGNGCAWNERMEVVADGNPHKVTRKDKNDFCASFEDCEYFKDGDEGWWFDGSMQYFEEVK